MRGPVASDVVKNLALALAFALALVGCTNGGEDERSTPTNVATYVPVSGLEPPTSVPPTGATPAPAAPVTGPLTTRSLAMGHNTPLQHPGRLALVDAGGWADIWANVREDPTAPAPEVDFERESVLLALHGPAPSTCYDIRITGAWLVNGEVQANVTTFTPEPAAACGDAITYPWHAVAVDRVEARAVWSETNSTGAAPP